ncbi:MAG TPA: macro domain-containing protein [candidate division Zixibacteria bacterium]|nr:macro domain-containing protein [candidate division Zixibacteria bacterium]
MAVPIEIDVWQGDVGELEVDAIVVAATESLFMTSAVGRALKVRAGESVERDAVAQGPVPAGTAVVTGGGLLAAPYVIHVVGVGHELRADEGVLASALDAAFDIAARLELRRLAMSPVGVERGVFAPDHAAAVLARVLQERAARGAPLPESLVVAVTAPGEAVAFRSGVEGVGTPSR